MKLKQNRAWKQERMKLDEELKVCVCVYVYTRMCTFVYVILCLCEHVYFHDLPASICTKVCTYACVHGCIFYLFNVIIIQWLRRRHVCHTAQVPVS